MARNIDYMKTRYEVFITGEPMQDFTDIGTAVDYVTKDVYMSLIIGDPVFNALTWLNALDAVKKLTNGEIFVYQYGFKQATIIPRGNRV